jgi:hypothetical protein
VSLPGPLTVAGIWLPDEPPPDPEPVPLPLPLPFCEFLLSPASELPDARAAAAVARELVLAVLVLVTGALVPTIEFALALLLWMLMLFVAGVLLADAELLAEAVSLAEAELLVEGVILADEVDEAEFVEDVELVVDAELLKELTIAGNAVDDDDTDAELEVLGKRLVVEVRLLELA